MVQELKFLLDVPLMDPTLLGGRFFLAGPFLAGRGGGHRLDPKHLASDFSDNEHVSGVNGPADLIPQLQFDRLAHVVHLKPQGHVDLLEIGERVVIFAQYAIGDAAKEIGKRVARLQTHGLVTSGDGLLTIDLRNAFGGIGAELQQIKGPLQRQTGFGVARGDQVGSADNTARKIVLRGSVTVES